MTKRNLKLIMELIFIFIIPLVILCINCNYQNTIEYDNNGNYQATEKHIEFNAPFTYTTTETITTNTLTHNNFEVSVMTHLYGDIYIATNYNNEQLFYGETSKEGMYTIYINSNKLYFNNDSTIVGTYEYDEIITINNVNYYKYIIDNNDDIYLYPFEDIYTDEGYYTLTTTTETITTNTIWGNLKNLIVDNLQIQDNQIVDIIITYTILWFIMFVIWHFFYMFFDGLVHIFIDWGHKEKEKVK